MNLFLPNSPSSGELVPKHVGSVKLTYCMHPSLVWVTRNAAPIGSHAVTFELNRVTWAPPCECPVSNLRILAKQ